MHLLHLEDSDTDAELIAHTLMREFPDGRIQQVRSRAEFQQALADRAYDVIIADYALDDYDGLAAFHFASRHCPDVPFVFVSGAIGEEKAIEAMRLGAADYVMKDRPARLAPAIRQALILAREKQLRWQKEAEVAATARLSELLVEIASELFLGATERSSLQTVWRRISAGVGADGHLYTALDAADSASVGTESALDPALLGGLTAPALADAISRGGTAENQVFTIAELQRANPAVGAVLRARGVRTLSCHTLRAGGRPLGVLTLVSTTRDQFIPAEASFLRTATDLVAAHLERNRLLQEVRQALQTAEQANRAKDDFVAALSHELRTPLNPVLLLATDAAANSQLPAEVRSDFAAIASHVTLEARLIDDLLDLTRMARNEVSLTFGEADVHSILADAGRVVASEAEAKGVTVEWRLDAPSPVIRGDAARLQQVGWKLLANAVKFTPRGGTIRVQTAATPEGTLVVTFADSGIGLTAEEIQRVFDPFARGDHAAGRSAEYTGLGLGLAIAGKIVELHGGRLHARSPGRGQGSTFTVELPLPKPPEKTIRLDPVARATPGPKAGGVTSLLLVEDHEPTRRALGVLLRRRGYRVVPAGGVAEARREAASHAFDLVLSDIGLPDGNGYELMSELHRGAGLIGIALTGFRMEPDDPQLPAAGFVSFLIKPVGIEQLIGAITKALADRGGANSPGADAALRGK